MTRIVTTMAGMINNAESVVETPGVEMAGLSGSPWMVDGVVGWMLPDFCGKKSGEIASITDERQRIVPMASKNRPKTRQTRAKRYFFGLFCFFFMLLF